MNSALIERVADAILYEGYILYPYRPSAMKNRQRWNFGGLCPRSYSESQGGNERWISQTECLVLATDKTTLSIRLRFLHLVGRQAAECTTAGDPCECEPLSFQPVENIRIGDRLFQTWQEAVERQFDVPALPLSSLTEDPQRTLFSFPITESVEPLRDAEGKMAGAFIRKQRELRGAVDVSAHRVSDSLFRIQVQTLNLTQLADAERITRDQAMMSSLVSSHLILTLESGEFVSLLDPPSPFATAAAGCKNVGGYPVLVGEEGERDAVLFSPVILYDYPKIAPESTQALFDGTEIDEILALRIMTLTDEEKREMRDSDERARAILEGIESHPEQLANLHGAIRGIGPAPETKS